MPSTKESTENSITSSSSKDSRAVEARTAYEGKYKPPKAIKHIKRLDAPPASAGGSVRKNSVALAQHQQKNKAYNDSISRQRQQVQSGSMVDNGEKKLRSKASIFSAEKIAKEDAKSPLMRTRCCTPCWWTGQWGCWSCQWPLGWHAFPYTTAFTTTKVVRSLGGNGTQDIYYDNMKLAIACVFLGSKSTDNVHSGTHWRHSIGCRFSMMQMIVIDGARSQPSATIYATSHPPTFCLLTRRIMEERAKWYANNMFLMVWATTSMPWTP